MHAHAPAVRSNCVLRAGRTLPRAVAAVALTLLPSAAALAANQYWDGDGAGVVNGGSGLWDTSAARWSPTAGGSTYAAWNNGNNDDAFLGNAGGIVQLGGDISLNSLTFGANYTLVNPDAGPATFNSTTGIIDTGSNRVEIQPAFAGGNGLTKNGSGVLIFHGANTYTGATTINAGTLALGNTAVADIPNSSPVGIASGATLDLGYFGGYYSDTVGTLSGAGTVKLGSAPSSFAPITTGSGLTIGADGGSNTFSGSISGAGGRLTKTGAGTQVLSGNNTFGGAVTITGGTLEVAGGNAIAASTPVFVIPDGTNLIQLQLDNNQTIGGLGGGYNASTPATVNLNGNTLTSNSSGDVEFDGILYGAGSLVKSGAGIQRLANANNTFVGSVSVNQGLLIATRDSSLGDSTNSVTLNGGMLANFTFAGVTWQSSRTFNLGSNGGGIRVLTPNVGGTITDTVNGNLIGGATGTFIKDGPGVLNLNGPSNSFAGGVLVKEGQLSANGATGAPLGTGDMTVQTGFVVFNPSGSAGATLNVATDPGKKFTYGVGSQLQANRGSNPVFTLNVGGTTSGSGLVPSGPGSSLTLIPGSLGTLGAASGNREVILVSGGVPVKNGMVTPRIVSWQSTGGSAGDWLTYGANGLALVSYTSGDINAVAGSTVVYNTQNTAQTLTANQQVYALHTNKVAVVPNGYTLTIGDGSAEAGLIMNVSGSIGTSSATTGSLVFNANEAVIYTQNTAGGNIYVPMSIGGSGGLTKFGYGSLTLNAPASYAGPTSIGQGIISLGVSNALPATTDVVIDGHTGLAFPTLRLNSFSQTVNSLSGISSVAVVDLGTGTLTLNQNANTTYTGVFTGVNSGATLGQLVKAGTGTLTLANQFMSPGGSYWGNNYAKLRISGGTVSAVSVNNLPAAASGTFLPDSLILENGSTLSWRNLASNNTALGGTDTLNQGAGLTLGTGGGTIEVTQPQETLVLQTVGVQSTDPANAAFNFRNAVVHDITGSGDLVKTGPGALQLYGNAAALNSTGTAPAPIANSYTGKTKLLGGVLLINDDGALGAVPASLVPDQLTIGNNAVLNTYGAVTLAANRGVTIAGGGQIYATNDVTLNGPLAGSGTLTKAGPSLLTLNAASPSFNGSVMVTRGQIELATSGALGTARFLAYPLFPVTISKTTGAADSVETNWLTVDPGSTVTVNSAGNGVGKLQFTGGVSGAGVLYKTGAGVLQARLYNLSGLVLGNGTVAVTANGTSTGASALTNLVISGDVAPAAQLDLADNDLVLANPSKAVQIAQLASAYAGGVWNGMGIASSAANANYVAASGAGKLGATALGYAMGSDLGVSSFDSLPVTPGSMIIKYTYYGDLNLDGRINGDDYALMDRSFAKHLPASWINGDLNYDGVVNSADYLLMDSAFAQQTGTLSPALLAERQAEFGDGYVQQLIAAVPEPGSLGLLGVAAAALAGRRIRRAAKTR